MSQVTFTQITKSFGTKTVLHPLDLKIEDGAFVALLGPSGCGKTTLLRILAGLETPDKGEIIIGNRRVTGPGTFIPPEERDLGMVFQSYAVWPHLNVYENVEFPLTVSRRKSEFTAETRRARVGEALSLVHMSEFQERKPHQLSGGQQQRVALARGLAMRPRVLLLDEPLSNLDARLRAEMRREIRDLHRKLKITILYVTHDQREAFEMATEVIVMNEGKIAQRGAPDEVKNNPEPEFVKDFLQEH